MRESHGHNITAIRVPRGIYIYVILRRAHRIIIIRRRKIIILIFCFYMRVRYSTRTYDIRRPPQPPELPAETTLRVHPTATGTTGTADNNKKLLAIVIL